MGQKRRGKNLWTIIPPLDPSRSTALVQRAPAAPPAFRSRALPLRGALAPQTPEHIARQQSPTFLTNQCPTCAVNRVLKGKGIVSTVGKRPRGYTRPTIKCDDCLPLELLAKGKKVEKL